MSEEQLQAEIKKLKAEVLDLIKRLEQSDIREKFLCNDKVEIQQDCDTLKMRNKTLEAAAQQDATIRQALLLLIGVLKYDISHLHSMAADEKLPSEVFTTEAMQVLEKIQGAFRLADLPLAYPVDQGTTTGVVAKIVEPKQEVG